MSNRRFSLAIDGVYTYGCLKAETGTHRLVRIPPFNADGKWQTSLAVVEVIPILEESVEFKIPEKDLEITTSRSVGNVNGVSTAVRIVHIPTGLAVACQEERTQMQNQERCLSILKSKLFAIARWQGVKEMADIQLERMEAVWSQQIREYVFHPYPRVKDLRTGVETTAVTEVINGEIDLFVNSYLWYENQL